MGHGGRVLRGPQAGGAADEQQEARSLHLHKHTIKLKPLEAPIFDGTARSYARFKHQFTEMIVSNYDQMGQLEFLVKALPAKIRVRMSLIQKTPDQILAQLEDIFEDPLVMLQEVMEELHALDASNLGENFMAKLATTLVDIEALLDQNENGDYLRHPREIANIQCMLPKSEKLEYMKREKNYIGSEFAKLKAFLLERKWEEDQLKKFGTGDCSDDTEKVQKICNHLRLPSVGGARMSPT